MPTGPYHVDRSPLSREQLNASCAVALRGFYTDPFFEFLAPKALQRNRGLFLFFRNALRHMGPGGHLSTVRDARDRIVGVSAWIEPGGYPQSIPVQLAAMPGSLRALYRRPSSLLQGGQYLEAMAKSHPKEPHWYLYLLVADPETQRQGVGTMLLNDRLPEVDEAHLGAYLETQKEDNIAYYRRFGFELVKPLSPVKGGPPVYTLWRAPK